MHRDSALSIFYMCKIYCRDGELAQAEKVGLEALDIFVRTLGPNHEWSKMCRDYVANIQKTKCTHAPGANKGAKK
jgi:hypothetical protein